MREQGGKHIYIFLRGKKAKKIKKLFTRALSQNATSLRRDVPSEQFGKNELSP